MRGETPTAGTLSEEPFSWLDARRISTSFDLEKGLQEALKRSEYQQDSEAGDSEGAETWLGEEKQEESEQSEDREQSDGENSGGDEKAKTRKRKKPNDHQMERKKAYARQLKNKKRKVVRQEKDAFSHKPGLYVEHKLGDIETVPSETSANDFDRTNGSWQGRGIEIEDTRGLEIEDLLAKGMRLIRWDGIKPIVVTDKEGKVVAIFVGRPQDPTWEKDSVPQIEALLAKTQSKLDFGGGECIPDAHGGSKINRRGDFQIAVFGTSFGGGQMEPGNLKHTDHNLEVLRTFVANHHVQRALKFGSNAFAYFAPWGYAYYVKMLSQLFGKEKRLERICKGSIFPALSLNFGPQAISKTHRDQGNLPDGLCWIMPCGRFNHVLGGHLILWELGLVVEFPSGSSALIPSAVISHGNLDIQEGETRMAITQFAAGGLFRWVEYGFQTEGNLKARNPRLFNKLMTERPVRWQESVGLFSRFADLEKDRRKAFYSQ